MSNNCLVYIGKIIDLQPIEGADFIVSATVVCGQGGKWKGIVRKIDFEDNKICVVFLPDSQLNEEDHFYLPFMKDSNWRVKMRRFKGAASEVLIIPYPNDSSYSFPPGWEVGDDVTEFLKVKKYHKPVPAHLQGIAIGHFPSFIPKTDEPNYQNMEGQELIEKLEGKHYYVTEKCDGSSTTAFRYKGKFGLCSRNLELERNENNGYWQVAIKYKLEELLPEGIALQWETCGPGIQSNPMGLKEIDGFAFSGYKIHEHRYLEMTELWSLLDSLKFPSAEIIDTHHCFRKDGLETRGEGKYKNGNEREGVVIRSQVNFGGKPISFKVINLGYEK